MSDRTCARVNCENPVTPFEGRGRPRKFCDEHRRIDTRKGRKSSYVPRPARDATTCLGCGAEFRPKTHNHRFCSRSCRQSSLTGLLCRVCKLPTSYQAGRESPDGFSQHKSCFKHGEASSYNKRGCRCELCTEAVRKVGAAYRRKRSAEGRPLHTSRKVEMRECRTCGTEFGARLDAIAAGKGAYCSQRCRILFDTGVDVDSADWVKPDRFRVTESFRLSIYERDAYVCWLCGELTRPDVEPSDGEYPSLDHVVPRSRGGDDTAENLRCAHRLCNSIKGARVVDDAFTIRDSPLAV